jgi:hypothetical protein
VRHIAIIIFSLFAGSVLAHDAKSNFLKALYEAKNVGLPTSLADLNPPASSKQTLALERLIEKASQTLQKYEPSFGQIVSIDFENLERKKAGKPEKPYPEPSPEQISSRTKETLSIIEQIGVTTAPRRVNSRSTPVDSFPQAARVKNFVSMELGEVTAMAAKGDAKEVVRKLKIVRRLVDLVRSDATVVGVLGQQASEQKYYASLQQIAKNYPAIGKLFTAELVAPFKKPTMDQILRDEFIQLFSTLEMSSKWAKKHQTISTGGWKLAGDKDSLELTSAMIKSWVVAYPVLKTAKTGRELEARYKGLAPKMGSYKMKNQDEEIELGPSWANQASVLDKAETKRQETIQVLGLG